MKKTILITGATDGIGLLTAQTLYSQGHNIIIHGRSAEKLDQAKQQLVHSGEQGTVSTIKADLSLVSNAKTFADSIIEQCPKLDVLINNAGVFKIANSQTPEGFDVRFTVNTLAPYILTKKLMNHMNNEARIVNLSSAAQAPVSLDAIRGQQVLSDNEAYAQSKLALTIWSQELGKSTQNPMIVSVNPASFLASKMVKSAYGIAGNDLSIGADILVKASLSDEFKDAHGKYFDNDSKHFSAPHSEASNQDKCSALIEALNTLCQLV